MVIVDKENRPNEAIQLDVNTQKGMFHMRNMINTLSLCIIHPKKLLQKKKII
jgi:hypothetical protein